MFDIVDFWLHAVLGVGHTTVSSVPVLSVHAWSIPISSITHRNLKFSFHPLSHAFVCLSLSGD